jgi:hypothetical protein
MEQSPLLPVGYHSTLKLFYDGKAGGTKRHRLFGLTNIAFELSDRLERKRHNAGGAGYHWLTVYIFAHESR